MTDSIINKHEFDDALSDLREYFKLKNYSLVETMTICYQLIVFLNAEISVKMIKKQK